MHKDGVVPTFFCLLLLVCLSFNNTFPLRRESTKATVYGNHTQRCANKKQEHGEGIVDRTKKMAANLEHALKKIIDTTPNNEKTKKEAKCSHAKQGVIDGDLSNYEQLVIMKKYPYLDLQELDFNYHPPPNKNLRQSLNVAPNLGLDSSFCELDVAPNVEITNRGLTGFAIPLKLVKSGNNANVKVPLKDLLNINETSAKMITLSTFENNSDNANPLKSLEEDIKEFEKLLR